MKLFTAHLAYTCQVFMPRSYNRFAAADGPTRKHADTMRFAVIADDDADARRRVTKWFEAELAKPTAAVMFGTGKKGRRSVDGAVRCQAIEVFESESDVEKFS